jgi:hypothetical protein
MSYRMDRRGSEVQRQCRRGYCRVGEPTLLRNVLPGRSGMQLAMIFH